MSKLLNDYYSTSDLALTTAISLWYPVDSIDKADPQKAIFLFKREQKLDELIETYWQGKLRVEPQTYFNQLRNIKSRLYEKE